MITATGLTKRYGATAAVDNLSFEVKPGIVTGFLGPNGAGKTTSMRLILGLDKPTAGSVTINGHAYREMRTDPGVGRPDRSVRRSSQTLGLSPPALAGPGCRPPPVPGR